MLLDQRRQHILHCVENKGFASLQELSELVDASESTVRRDLEYLDGIGQIRRTRGGASYIGESLATFDERSGRALPAKQRVARAVAALIESGETVVLDGGTTTLEVARHLTDRRLQVVTNSLPVANVLANQPHIELIVVGGYVYPHTGVALGGLAVSCLQQLHARRLVISVGGITEKGLFNSNALLVETERQMMAAADETIVATDSSKLGHAELAHLASLSEIDRLVVDAGITDDWRNLLEESGVDVIVVDA